ncbi:Pyoverdine/dityrosine biosynthesis protein-domain-containing protein [Aspergillus aurantiobrunneus]
MSINYGASVYHHVVGIYQRDQTGELLVAEGKHAEQIRSRWSEISSISRADAETTQLPSGKTITTTQSTLLFSLPKDQPEQPHALQIHELQEPGSCTVGGLITSIPSPNLQSDFFNWAKTFLLLQSRFLTTGTSSDATNPEALALAERITTLFEETLKNTSQDDQWLPNGRTLFINKAYSFIKDGKRIELCLPAFPCKSSNPQKVAGISPDAAEYLALGHLHNFVAQVSRIYAPGATLWIISDGHVFSDNIGVDDALVDSYGETLAAEYHRRFARTTSKGLIQFTGLEDLFFSFPEATAAFSTEMLHDVSLPQPIETVRTESAQKCRLLLEKVGGIDREHLRELINNKHKDTLSLYQGQSRFMLEDLSTYLAERNIGSKAKKRVASAVAAEMIARNHAYSNLVELLFPHHIRLSIHAHTNSGPKFGIRLFPKGTVRPVQDMQSLLCATTESKPDYEFQIPTAWHNCLLEVEGSDTVLLTRSAIAREAIASGQFEGAWCETAEGGYFALRRVVSKQEETQVAESQAVTEAETEIEPVVKEPLSGLSVKQQRVLRVFGGFFWDGIVGLWGAIRAAGSEDHDVTLIQGTLMILQYCTLHVERKRKGYHGAQARGTCQVRL